MRRIRASILVILAFCVPGLAQTDKEPDAPTGSQIRLLLSQSERAFEAYEDAIKVERTHFVGDAAESVRRDEAALSAARSLLASFGEY